MWLLSRILVSDLVGSANVNRFTPTGTSASQTRHGARMDGQPRLFFTGNSTTKPVGDVLGVRDFDVPTGQCLTPTSLPKSCPDSPLRYVLSSHLSTTSPHVCSISRYDRHRNERCMRQR